MKTTNELAALVGKRVLVQIEKVQVSALVLDTKNSYGQIRAQVQIDGNPPMWISAARITEQTK